MDENKDLKDEALENEPETPSAGENDALNEELENIRNLFQRELNGEDVAENKDENIELPNGEVIQSLEDSGLEFEESDEISVEHVEHEGDDEEEIDDEDLCECCGKRKRDTTYGSDYPYCSECRKLMKHNPLNAVGVIITLIVFALVGVSMGLMVSHITNYVDALTGLEAYQEHKLGTAIVELESYFDSADEDNVSMKAVKAEVDTFAQLGYYSNAVDLINEYYTEDQLASPLHKDMAQIISDNDLLQATSDYISEEYSQEVGGTFSDYKKSMKALDKDIADNLEKADDAEDKYSQTFLEYVKYLFMYSHDESNEDILSQLLQVKATDEEETGGRLQWLYSSYLLSAYAKAGDIENAEAYFNEVLAINSQDLNSYGYYASAYRYSIDKNSTDADVEAAAQKILDIAEEEANNYESQFSYPTYYREYAIGYLLQGQTELAKTNIDNFINNCSSSCTISDYYLYAFVCKVAGDSDTYKEIKSFLEGYSYSLPNSVTSFKTGNTNLADIIEVLCNPEGDF